MSFEDHFRRMGRRATESLDPMMLTQRLLVCDLQHADELRVLDVGSGEGRLWSRLAPDVRRRLQITGVDADPMWRDPEQRRLFVESIIQGSAPDVLSTIESESFDVVTAYDLIEHMDRSSGYRLLYEMERIARRRCLVFTPNGMVWQPPAPNNPFNAHVSGWYPRDFVDFGWRTVYGCVGLRSNYGPYAMRRHGEPGSPGRWPLRAADVLVRRVPSAAFSFLATTTDLPRWRPAGC